MSTDTEYGALLVRRERAQRAFEEANRELGILTDRLSRGISGGGIALSVAANGDLCALEMSGDAVGGKRVVMPTTNRLKELVQQKYGAYRELQEIKVALGNFR